MVPFRRRCPAHCDHEETCQGSSTFLSPKFDVFLFACFFVFVSGTLWIWCCEMAWAHIYFIILVIYVFVCWLWMKVVISAVRDSYAFHNHSGLLGCRAFHRWLFFLKITGSFQMKAARNMKHIQTTRGGISFHRDDHFSEGHGTVDLNLILASLNINKY